ncbi:MAG: DUF177 domain-containing protein [Candidatus Omnitrophica bacterium]|nr:DUF177 domain-containing protein [Candidatus Omnitrophota bacterium]
MKIKILDIPPQGLEFTSLVPPSFLGVGFDLEGAFLGPLRFTALVHKTADQVTGEAQLAGELATRCSRCLTEVTLPWNVSFSVDISYQRHDESVDLTPDVRDEMILGLPVKILCVDACRGLCAGCGVNLNIKSCKCQCKE